MFYVLVKFTDQKTPVLLGTSGMDHASRLATMTGVEWVSPTISGNGDATSFVTGSGGHFDGNRIVAYKPPFNADSLVSS